MLTARREKLSGKPVVRQKFRNSVDGMSANARENVAEPGEGIDFGTLTGSHKTAQHGVSFAANIAAKEHPVVATHSDAAMLRSVAELSISGLPSSA